MTSDDRTGPSRPAARGASGSRQRAAESVGELLPRVLDELGLGATSDAVRLVKVWDEALGESFAPHCRPEGLRGGVVQARVQDSAWMQRLQLEKPRILARLALALGDSAPTDIRLRIG